jgi:flagella basal body P-ring formation protein FlgA
MTCKLLLPLLLASSPLAAQSLADLAAIDRAVALFTRAAPGQPGGAALPVDRRLRLAACPVAPVLDWASPAQAAVRVTCPAAGGWRLHVPLLVAGEAAAAPAIARGDAITIAVGGEGFRVAQPGEALESGAPGAWIKVRALAAGARPMRAKVLRAGLVGIDLP